MPKTFSVRYQNGKSLRQLLRWTPAWQATSLYLLFRQPTPNRAPSRLREWPRCEGGNRTFRRLLLTPAPQADSLYFWCQKYQKHPHGENCGVLRRRSLSGHERSEPFAAQRAAPLRLWRLGNLRQRDCSRLLIVFRTPAPGAHAAAPPRSAIFTVRSFLCRLWRHEIHSLRRQRRRVIRLGENAVRRGSG